jgi:hypothetical protein
MNKDIKIFINYRRADSPCFAERVRDWFTLTYKRENVFMDFDAIPPFVNFEEFIIAQIRKVDVVLAIIGPQWLEILQERTKDDDTDFVRLELRSALAMNKLVAPILVEGASAPDPDLLPEDIRPIMRANAPRLDGGRQFLDNIERVVEALPIALAQHQALAAARPSEAEKMIDPVATMNFRPSAEPIVPITEEEVSDVMFEDDMFLDDVGEANTEIYGGLATLEVEPLTSSELPPPALQAPPAPQAPPSREKATPPQKMVRIGYAPSDVNHAETMRDALNAQIDNATFSLATSGQPMHADLILLLLTSNSRQDPAVRDHISWAHSANIPILPVLMKGDADNVAPYALSLNQMIDMRETDDIPGMVEAVRMYL